MWIDGGGAALDARLRLFCYPYSGGAANAFRPWGPQLLPHVELRALQPPGRWARLREPALRSATALAEDAAKAIRPLLDDRPYALYGHSVGALVVFEMARVLRRLGAPMPSRLIVGARGAPDAPVHAARFHSLSDGDLVAAVTRSYGPLPAAVIADEEMRAMFLPVLRADFEANAVYGYRPEPPLDVPITAFTGTRDATVSRDIVASWQRQTTRTFDHFDVDGDHFFAFSSPAFVQRLVGLLSAAPASPSG